MGKYIPLDAVVAETERMQDAYIAKLESRGMGHEEAVMASISYVKGIKDIINSLEVKEVDLSEEIEKCLKRHSMLAVGKKDFTDIAKHFFELGLKHRKESSMTDKVQKILSKIETRKLCTMDEHMAFYNDKAKEDYRFLSEIEEFIKED